MNNGSFDFGDDRVKVVSPEKPRDLTMRTMSYAMSAAHRVQNALQRRDWRELNRLGAVWWDQYGSRWHKFTQYFWDA